MDRTNNPDEILDVVNEKDEVVGKADRKTVHSDKLLIHREVGIIVYDDNDQVLLQQRSRLKTINPLAWSWSASGHVPYEMLPLNAAINELKEEVGLTGRLEFAGKWFIDGNNNRRFASWYRCKYSGEKIVINRDEVEQVKWVTKNQAERMIKNGEKFSSSAMKALGIFWKTSIGY
jgi:isopentenyldiphosphate isomerase